MKLLLVSRRHISTITLSRPSVRLLNFFTVCLLVRENSLCSVCHSGLDPESSVFELDSRLRDAACQSSVGLCDGTSGFQKADNFLATNNMPAPNIAIINAIRPKNSTSAKNKPRPCCIRSINERIDATPETRAIRSTRPPAIHSPIDINICTLMVPTGLCQQKNRQPLFPLEWNLRPPYIHSLF